MSAHRTPDPAETEQRRAVTDVMTSYATGVDQRDWSLIKSCFHPDAHIRGTRMTASFSEYFPVFRNELEKFERTFHFLGNQRYRGGIETARLETYAVARHFWTDPDGARQQMTLGVRYRDDFQCRDGDWRIARRNVDLDWSDTSPPGAGLVWTAIGSPAEIRS